MPNWIASAFSVKVVPFHKIPGFSRFDGKIRQIGGWTCALAGKNAFSINA